MGSKNEEYAVEVVDLNKTYRTGDIVLDILKGVCCCIKKGELVLITGHSGSGKTTLLSIIAGTLRFDSGDVILFGKNLKEMTEDQITEFRKKYVGFIFQQFCLLNNLTVLQNISIPLLLNGYHKHKAMEISAEMLCKVGLKGKELMKPTRLSGGEQQRVAIARALVNQPWLLICDEPTAALDADNGARIMELLSEIAKTPNRSIVIVTHDDRIFKYGDSMLYLENGVIIEQKGK